MTDNRLRYLLTILVVTVVAAICGAVGGGYLVYNLVEDRLSNMGPLTTAEVQAKTGLETRGPSTGTPTPGTSENDTTDSATGEAASEATVVAPTFSISSGDIATTITEVVQRVGPAVVTVVGTAQVPVGPFGQLATTEVSGSGVFVNEDGTILTSNHVVEDTLELWVVLADGSKHPARIIGRDRYADLAVLKTDAPVPAVATLGNSDSLDPGETVIAIGSPLGEFTNSVTVGVVSATGRAIDTGYGYQIEELIQTDTAINEGNSGGPLVNLAGEVVGINTLVVRAGESGTIAEGLGFAIASNAFAPIAEQIIRTGSFSRPRMGIDWREIDPYIAYRYRLPVEYGVYVTEVAYGGPAYKAGLQVGDIINQVGGVELDGSHPFLNLLYQHQPGDKVTIGFVREGRQLETQIVLGASS